MSDGQDKTQDTAADAQSNTDKKDYAQLIQAQVAEIKQELLQRIDLLKAQLPLNQEDLVSLKDTLKTEVSAIIEDVSLVSKELKQDLTELSAKHKDSISATLQRTKDHTLDVWNKLQAGEKSADASDDDKTAG